MEQTKTNKVEEEPCHIELFTGQIVIFRPCNEQSKKNNNRKP